MAESNNSALSLLEVKVLWPHVVCLSVCLSVFGQFLCDLNHFYLLVEEVEKVLNRRNVGWQCCLDFAAPRMVFHMFHNFFGCRALSVSWAFQIQKAHFLFPGALITIGHSVYMTISWRHLANSKQLVFHKVFFCFPAHMPKCMK